MATKTWNNSAADWNTPGDWSPTGVPGAADDVVINGGEPELLSGATAIKVKSITLTGGFLAIQDPGKTQSVSGNVSISGSGTLQLDGVNLGGPGGSSMTIGGALSNTSGNNGISIGNTGISSADIVTVNGTGGLSNSGVINIVGSAVAQATLNVANAAAGFGAKGVETGNVFMQNDALLEFKTGQITTVNGQLWLDGAKARVADAGATGSNSALTGLTTDAGSFYLENGASVTTTGPLSIVGGARLGLDGNNTGGPGGSSLTIGGNLTNSSTDGNGVSIGNTGITSTDTLTVNGKGGLSSTGFINIEGNVTTQATLNVANAAAGFGTKGVETGTVLLQNDALLEFKSGEITTINGTLRLIGPSARVADAGATGSNSALTGLTSVAGNFWVQNGTKVAPAGNLNIIGGATLGVDGNNTGGSGGSSLTISGKLTNSSNNGNGVSIGNTGITSADTLTVNGAGGLSNSSASFINIEGNVTTQATLNVANAVAGFGTKGVETGTVLLQNDALLEFKSGEITTIDGTLRLIGPSARVADAGATGSNSALTGLTSVAGNFWVQNGTKVAPANNLSIIGGATLGVDGNNTGGSGGSSLTIGGKLTNTSNNGNGVSVGNTGITSADTLTVNGAGGLSNSSASEINIEGNVTTQATLNVKNAAAGFGTKGVETGTVFLQNDALLEFKSGSITSVEGTLRLIGASARVADAGTTGSNSALTGLNSVSGNFWLQNGAKVATTGNLSIIGGATLGLDGNNTGGSGGTSLTIGGTLTNSSSNGNGVSVGNSGISAADTLTVKGTGGLSNTGNINIQGSASAAAKLVVTNAVTSSGGTILIGNFAGSLGDVTATAVNITGGLLEGFGTVTGALRDTGGTVLGGFQNSTIGTLTVNGAYNQSGGGVLQADINTFSTQQSSIVNVTGTPGTPGAPGSVNLAGGTLLIEGETSLALDTPYTVMSFGPNRLYGEFAQVETQGALGNATGNSTSVNLGNGNTLEVLYNETSGTVQVELVATPTKTTYDWDVGSGTWNASSAANWNPPGNKTTPSGNSNVTIGTGSGGTVTLAQDQTINSLSITNGYTLSGATHSITTNAGVSVASGATLSLHSMNVGGVFTDMGSVTLAGVLTINKGGRLTLSKGSFTGGINGSGTFETNTGTTGTLKDVTIFGGTTFTASNNATTNISGTIGGRGTLQVNGGGGTSGFLKLIGATTLSGGGTVSLTTTKGGGSATIEGAGLTLTNANDVIEGTGTIGVGSLALSNGGMIDANISAGTLLLNGTGGITNTGVFEATGGGILDVAGAITGKGGTLEIGAGSEVELGGATSQASTFLASSGKLSIDNATKTTYSGVINSFVSGDILELGSTNATSVTPTKNGVDTTLTVDLSSGGPLTYTLAGNLTGDTFNITHVGGNSDISIATTAAFGEAHSLLRDPIGSSFVRSSDIFGASNERGSAQLNLAASLYTHA